MKQREIRSCAPRALITSAHNTALLLQFKNKKKKTLRTMIQNISTKRGIPSDGSETSGPNLPKKTKPDVKQIRAMMTKLLDDKSFQNSFIKSVLLKNLQSLLLTEDHVKLLKEINKQVSLSKFFKDKLPELCVLVVLLVKDSNSKWLRLDIIADPVTKKKQCCAHLYYKISKDLVKNLKDNIFEDNSCSFCSLSSKDSNVSVFLSEIQFGETALQVQNRIQQNQTTTMPTDINALLKTCDDCVKRNADTTVTLPCELYNVLIQMIQQQNVMKIEIEQLKRNLTQSKPNEAMITEPSQNEHTNKTNMHDNVNTSSNANLSESMNSRTNFVYEDIEEPAPNSTREKATHSMRFKKNKLVPPIFVDSEICNQQTLLNIIKSRNIDMNSMRFFPANNKQIRIEINDLEIYDKVHQILTTKNITLHTHAVKSRVKPVYIIKNLCRNFDLEDIKDDLKDQNFSVIDISRFETKFHIENNIDSRMVKVVLPENTDTKAFEQIRFILHIRVYIQMLRPSAVLQCKRCQRINHSANYCTYPYRCVKCTENHEPGQCKLNAPGNTLKPKCCNCGGEHAASSYDCQYISNEINRRKNKNKQENKAIFTNVAPQRNTMNRKNAPTTSYSNVVKAGTNKKPSTIDVMRKLKNCMLAMQETIDCFIDDNGQ